MKYRRDANHKPIVDELLARGIDVVDLSKTGDGVCDIATWHRGKTVFIELKYGSRPALKKKQIRFLAHWRGYSGIARNVEEATALATDPVTYGLTDAQKDKLGAYHATMTAKEVHLPTILKEIDA